MPTRKTQEEKKQNNDESRRSVKKSKENSASNIIQKSNDATSRCNRREKGRNEQNDPVFDEVWGKGKTVGQQRKEVIKAQRIPSQVSSFDTGKRKRLTKTKKKKTYSAVLSTSVPRA